MKRARAVVLVLAAAGAAYGGQRAEEVAVVGQPPAAGRADEAALGDLMRSQWQERRFEAARRTAERILKLHPADAEALEIERDAPTIIRGGRASRARQRAAQAYQDGRFDEAVSLYREIVALEPSDVLALRDLMWALWRADRIDEAMDAGRDLLKLKPGDVETGRLLERGAVALEDRQIAAQAVGAQALAGQKRFDEAAAAWRALVEKRPANAAFRLRLIRALRDGGRLPEALAQARRLAAAAPRDPEALGALGTVEFLLGDAAAEGDIRRSLALKADQPALQLKLGVLQMRARDFPAAEKLLAPLEGAADQKLAADAVKELGETLFWEGRFAEALPRLEATARAFPDDVLRRYLHAWCLLRLGRVADGRAELSPLSAKGDRRALRLLVDDALARGDSQYAVQLASSVIPGLSEADEVLVLRLADVLWTAGLPDEGIRVLDRFLAVFPGSQPVWVEKANIAAFERRYRRAKSWAERASLLNPAAHDPGDVLIEAAMESGDFGGAHALAEASLRKAPASPQAVLRAAEALYRLGRRTQARGRVRAWLERNQAGGALPILLYHALTRSETDPILAYKYNHSARMFEDHVRALARAGYTPITIRDLLAWISGKGDLPAKPVLITFDDARRDSFELGDPILARYGMRASMMVPLVNVDGPGHPAGYAPWSLIQSYAANGRWEIEAHGDNAHNAVTIDARGRRGLFLINRKWDPAAGRLETTQEWKARLDADYEACRRRIADHAGRAPVAYAYPEGAAGQQADISNSPDAFAVNRELVSKYYRLAFVQDYVGINLRGQDPYALARVEPDNKWTGEALVRHLTDSGPIVSAYVMLFDWAVEERNFSEARGLLAKLEALGVSRQFLLTKDASLRYYAGDIDSALSEAQKAAAIGEDKEAQHLLASMQAEDRPAWSPAYEYYHDSDARTMWSAAQGFELGRYGKFRPRALYRIGELRQRGLAFVRDNAFGAGVEAAVRERHTLWVDGAEHLLTKPAPDFFSAQGGWSADWGGGFGTTLEGHRNLLYSAPAVANGISQEGGVASAKWTPGVPWTFSGSLQRDWLTDGNSRWTAQGEAGRQLAVAGRFDVRGVFRSVYDDAVEKSPFYYAPQRVVLEALGPEVGYAIARRTSITARYLPAVASERGVGVEFVNEAQAALTAGWSQADSLQVSFDLDRTPTYRAIGVSTMATIRF